MESQRKRSSYNKPGDLALAVPFELLRGTIAGAGLGQFLLGACNIRFFRCAFERFFGFLL